MSEQSGTLKYKDKNGSEYSWYPVTKLQNVIGLTNILLNKQDTIDAGTGIKIENNVISIDTSVINSPIFTTDNYYNFPTIGDENTIYIDEGENKIYRWDSTNLKYFVIGSDYNDIDIVNGSF